MEKERKMSDTLWNAFFFLFLIRTFFLEFKVELEERFGMFEM